MRIAKIVAVAILALSMFGACRGMTGETIEIVSEIPVDSQAGLTLENVTGSVDISGAARSSIGMVATVSDQGLAPYSRYVDVHDVSIQVENDALVRIHHQPFDAQNIRVNYELELPDDMPVGEISTVTGGIQLVDVSGDPALYTTTGDIRVNHLDGTILVSVVTGDILVLDANAIRSLSTVTGSIEAEVLGLPSGDAPVAIATTTGSVTLAIDPTLAVSIQARTVTGRVSVDPAVGTDSSSSTHQASVSVAGGGRLLTIKATTGDIRIIPARVRQ